MSRALYLAISLVIDETGFLRKGTHEITRRRQVKLLVVDLEREEITQWIQQ